MAFGAALFVAGLLMITISSHLKSNPDGFKAIDGSQVKVSKAELGQYCDAALGARAAIGSGADPATVAADLTGEAAKLDDLSIRLKDATAAQKVRDVRDAMLVIAALGNGTGTAADPSLTVDRIVAAFNEMPPCGDFQSSS